MIVQKTKVADEVWIAVALLHRENPKREDFTITEILERARREKIAGELRPGFQVHVYLHCVVTAHPTLVVIECFMPPAKILVACFGKVMTSIQNVAGEK